MSTHSFDGALTPTPDWQSAYGLNRPSNYHYAMLEELKFVRREAQAEADLAYEDWARQPDRDRYAVYLAARDRADACQDALARVTRQLPA
jgi:hypothetical protein